MSNPFLEAAKAGDLPTIKLMLAENPGRITELGEQGSTALLLAAALGQLETVMWLLRAGGANMGEVDNYGNSALLVPLLMGSWKLSAGCCRKEKQAGHCKMVINTERRWGKHRKL
jgi:ankyrin repeat protein